MDKQRKMKRSLTILACLGCLFFSTLWLSLAEAKKETVRFNGPHMSADIDDICLKDVFKKINAQKDFWFKGDTSVLERTVSVCFDDLTFQEGLKRILGHINHILLYDSNKEPSGVIITGGGSRKQIAVKRSDTKLGRDATGRRPVVEEDTGAEIGGWSPRYDLTPPTAAKLASMEVTGNEPVPGGPVVVSFQELEMFSVEQSKTPPGGEVIRDQIATRSIHRSSDVTEKEYLRSYGLKDTLFCRSL